MQSLDFPAIRTRVQAAMAAQGLSQRALAGKAGIAQAGLSAFLNGKAGSLTLANVTALGDALGEDFWIKPGGEPANGVRREADREAPAPAGDPDWRRIPLLRLKASKANPRKTFGAADLAELADSIAAHGVLQNLVVRRAGLAVKAARAADVPSLQTYEIVAGERRFRALQLLAKADRIGRDELVPCRIVDAFDDADHLALALVENLQREAVPPLEEAAAFKQLAGLGWGTEKIAGAVKRSRRHVQLRLALVDRLAAPAQKALTEGRITLDHARVLATVGPTLQKDGLAELTGSGYSNVRTADQLRKHLHRDFVPVDKALLPPPPDWTAPADGTAPGAGGLVEIDGAVMFENRRAFIAWQADAVARRRQVLADQWAWCDVVEPWQWAATLRGNEYGAQPYQVETDPAGKGKPILSDDRTLAGAVIAFEKYSGEAVVHEGILRAPEEPEDEAGDDAAPAHPAARSYDPLAAARLNRRRQYWQDAVAARAAEAPALALRILLFSPYAGHGSGPGINWYDDTATMLRPALADCAPALADLLGTEDDMGNAVDAVWRDDAAAWSAIAALDETTLLRLAAAVIAPAIGVPAEPTPILRQIAEAHSIALDPPDDEEAQS
jgi:ParB family chromosome partitioning protein